MCSIAMKALNKGAKAVGGRAKSYIREKIEKRCIKCRVFIESIVVSSLSALAKNDVFTINLHSGSYTSRTLRLNRVLYKLEGNVNNLARETPKCCLGGDVFLLSSLSQLLGVGRLLNIAVVGAGGCLMSQLGLRVRSNVSMPELVMRHPGAIPSSDANDS